MRGKELAIGWRRLAQASALSTGLLLAACRTPPAEPPVAPAAPVAEPAPVAAVASIAPAPERPSLVAEQKRLAGLFRGTPVVFAMQSDGSLRVGVPLRFCFERGKTSVRPPLAAVLDRLATSQQDGESHVAISAPGDVPVRGNGANSARAEMLGHRRAASIRDHLSVKGIADGRMTIASNASGVKLVLRDVPRTP